MTCEADARMGGSSGLRRTRQTWHRRGRKNPTIYVPVLEVSEKSDLEKKKNLRGGDSTKKGKGTFKQKGGACSFSNGPFMKSNAVEEKKGLWDISEVCTCSHGGREAMLGA